MPDTMEEEDAAPVVRILHAPPSHIPACTSLHHNSPHCSHLSGGVSFALSLGWLARQAGRQAGSCIASGQLPCLPYLAMKVVGVEKY
jgi:hypothetical protein